MKPVWTLPLLIVALLAPALANADSASHRLFELLPDPAPLGLAVSRAWRVAVDTQTISGASRFHLEMPDGLEFDVVRSRFERRGAESGVWTGRLLGDPSSEVLLSLTDGVLAGWIHSRWGDYQVRPAVGGDYVVSRIEAEQLPGCGMRFADPIEQNGPTPIGEPVMASDAAGRVDIMVLYTPQARDDAGGAGSVKAVIGMMIDTANLAFSNSRMDARLNLAYSGIAPFDDLGVGDDDLDLLTDHARVAALRNEHQADLVALIGSEALVTGPEAICGIAWVMVDEIGNGFAPYAFSVTSLVCTGATFAHEIGHNLGFFHDPVTAEMQSFPLDRLLFPWAFGHFFPNDVYTVMTYRSACGYCERILNFSNPRVDHQGKPTGIEGERDNARVGNQTAPAVANFRLSGVLFEDDFEGTSLSSWSTVRSGLDLVAPGLDGSSQALQVSLLGSAALKYLAHKVPAPGLGVDVEFLLNMNGADLGTAEIELLEFFGQGQRHLTATVRQTGGSYLLTLKAKANSGDYVEIASTPLRALITEKIGIIWRAATELGADDGYVRLLKNDGPRGTVNDLANDTRIVREIRIGTPAGSAGAVAGETVLIDNYGASAPTE